MKCLVSVLFILMLLNACNNYKGKEVRIGFLIHTTQSERWQMDLSYVQERAQEIGANLILKDADGDENMQLKQAAELLEEGVDAIIVVAANQNTAAGIVREAHRYNVPVIAYDRLIKNSDLDYLVSFEYDKVGKIMIDYAVARKPHGNYMAIWGDASDANAVFVKEGNLKALKPYLESGEINLDYMSYVDGWSLDNAKHKFNEVLDFYDKKLDAVIVSNDAMAVGAFQALAEHGYDPGEVVITGQDATLAFVHSMLKDEMTMSVYKPIKELAYGTVDLVVELVKHHKAEGFDQTVDNGIKDVPAKLFSPSIVDKSNFEEVLIRSGIFTHEEVFGLN